MAGKAVPASADVVVIGAGMGGLTAAALLAKAGLSVCVLEMDARPGGYLAGFERRKFVFDTAIHWLNQCGSGGLVRRVLDFVDASSPQTPPLRHIRRYRGESFDYLLTDRPDDLRDALIADFPDEAAGIAAFFEAAREIGDTFAKMTDHVRAAETMPLLSRAGHGMTMGRITLPFVKYVRFSTEDGFTKKFRAPSLAQVFCSEERLLACLSQVGWAYTGDYQVPPAGGSRSFVRFLSDAVEAWDGAVVLRAAVEQIHVQEGRAVGVTFRRGAKGEPPQRVDARWVLAACDVEAVYERMLPAGAVPPEVRRKVSEAELYPSSVSVALGLDVPTESLGFGEELVFLTRDGVPRSAHSDGEADVAGISILAPSLRDPSMAPPGKGTLTLMTTAWMDFEDRWKTGPGLERGAEYKAFKQRYADTLIDRVAEAMCPDLRDHIEICDVATPVTHKRYTGNRDGSIMAARPSRANFRNKVAHYRTPVDRLLLAGHWAELGGGVPIATRAGANAALLVLREERPDAFDALAEVLDGKRAPTDVPEGLRKL